MTTRRARWAGVEFQRDLKNPRTPVRLGLVLQESLGTAESSVIVIGRMPKIDARPEGFENTGDMIMQVASKWVRLMTKEAFDGPSNDVFARLAESWHWNLYVVQPATIKLSERADLFSRAKSLYREFVGEPFAAAPARLRRRRIANPRSRARIETPPATPPAWMLDEIMRHRLGVHAGR